MSIFEYKAVLHTGVILNTSFGNLERQGCQKATIICNGMADDAKSELPR